MPQCCRHRCSGFFHKGTLVIVGYCAHAVGQGGVDFIKARLGVLDDIGRVAAIEFEDETGNHLAFAVRRGHTLANGAADFDLSQIANPDGASVDCLDRRFHEIGDRCRQTNAADRVLLGAQLDELRTCRSVGALQGVDHFTDLNVLREQ